MLSQLVFVLKIASQVSFYPFALHEISVLIELTLGHLCYRLTDVPPQPNSPPDCVRRAGLCGCSRTRVPAGLHRQTPSLNGPRFTP